MTTMIDRQFGTTSQGYRLTRVHRLGGHVLRVEVHRDNRAEQSRAVAEVLTPQMTWTHLCSDLPSGWFDATPHYTAPPDTALDDIADRLLHRATAILTIDAPPTGPATPKPGRVPRPKRTGHGA